MAGFLFTEHRSHVVLAALYAFGCAAACGGEEFTSAGGEGGSGAAPASSSSVGAEGGSGGSSSTAGTGGTFTTDCDPGSVCLLQPPGGWEGPVAVVAGDQLACGGAWAQEDARVFGGVPTATHSCSPCICDVPQGGACEPPDVELFSSNTCSGGSVMTITPNADGQCTALGNGFAGAKAKGEASSVPGTCTPHGGNPNLGEPTWDSQALLCSGGAPGEACG